MQFGFVENLYPQAFSLGQLAAGRLSRHQVVGFLADAAAHFAAGAFNQGFGVTAAEVGQCASENKGFAQQRAAAVAFAGAVGVQFRSIGL